MSSKERGEGVPLSREGVLALKTLFFNFRNLAPRKILENGWVSLPENTLCEEEYVNIVTPECNIELN